MTTAVTDDWSRVVWTAVVGVVAALLALVVAGALGYLLFEEPLRVAGAVLGAVLVAPAVWWVLVECPRKATVGRGVLAGALTGAGTPPVVWIVWFGAGLDLGPIDGGPTRLLGYAAVLVFVGIAGSLYSLLFVG